MIKRKNLFSLLLTLGILIPAFSYSQQCRKFAEKRCKVFWGEFVSNGQSITAELESGESADLTMIFHRAHDYRIVICAEENLGEIEFKIKSTSGDILFDNKDYDMTPEWEFTMTSTQRLLIEVSAAGGGGEEFLESGCVAMLIGLKSTPKKGFH